MARKIRTKEVRATGELSLFKTFWRFFGTGLNKHYQLKDDAICFVTSRSLLSAFGINRTRFDPGLIFTSASCLQLRAITLQVPRTRFCLSQEKNTTWKSEVMTHYMATDYIK